jgi:hypothetical protein
MSADLKRLFDLPLEWDGPMVLIGAMPLRGRPAVPSGSSHVSLSRPKAADAIASGEIPPGIAIASAYGGYIGIAVMMIAAALIGAMLAIGGVL